MDLTMFLAQILGIYMLVAGVSGLLYPSRAQKAMAEVTKSYAIPYFDGAIALIFGLLIVLTHNVWVGAAATIITLIGWIAIVEGVFMLLLPHDMIAKTMERFSGKNMAAGWSMLAIILGGYLAYVGFLT